MQARRNCLRFVQLEFIGIASICFHQIKPVLLPVLRCVIETALADSEAFSNVTNPWCYQSLVLPILGVTNPWHFQTHSPVSASPWGTPQFIPLSSISSSLTLWSSVGSCPPFSSSVTPFCQLLPFFFFPVGISEVFLLVLISVLLAVESTYVILWMFLFKIRGVVDACLCELHSCIHAGIYTAEVQEQKAPQQFV